MKKPRLRMRTRRTSSISPRTARTIHSLIGSSRRLTQELGRPPTAEELALEAELIPYTDRLTILEAMAANETLDPNIERSIRRAAAKVRRLVRQSQYSIELHEPTNEELLGIDMPVLVQNIITPFGRVPEGKLVKAVAVVWKLINGLLKENPNIAYEIPPYAWEELIAAAFDYAGYDEVILTPRSGDFGRDVIAVKHGVGTIRIIDSVKAYAPGHLVRHDDVRALLGVLSGDPQASKGILTTTSDFAPEIVNDPYIKPFIPYRLELMNGPKLRKWLEELTKA